MVSVQQFQRDTVKVCLACLDVTNGIGDAEHHLNAELPPAGASLLLVLGQLASAANRACSHEARVQVLCELIVDHDDRVLQIGGAVRIIHRLDDQSHVVLEFIEQLEDHIIDAVHSLDDIITAFVIVLEHDVGVMIEGLALFARKLYHENNLM